MKHLKKLIGLGTLATLLALAPRAGAAATPLTGGDPGDGYVAPAPASVVVAYDLAGGGVTVQGVTFSGYSGNGAAAPVPAGVTVTGGGGAGYIGTFNQSVGNPFGGAGDDLALGSLLDTQAFGFNAPMEFTITGLQNTTYRVDQFFYAVDSANAETFTINGNLVGTGPSANGPYVETDFVTVTGGQIVLSDGNPSSVTRLNGFAISTIPEPAGMGALALGGLTLFRRSGRRVEKAA